MTQETTMSTVSTGTRRLAYMTTAVTLAILIIGGVTLWQTIGARASSDAIRDSSLVAACRSELRADIDLAIAQTEASDSERDDLIIDGLLAVAAGDEAQLAAVLANSEHVLARTDRAQTEALAAIDRYSQGVTLSRTDPARFLEVCER